MLFICMKYSYEFQFTDMLRRSTKNTSSERVKEASELTHVNVLFNVRLELFNMFHINNEFLYGIFSINVAYAIVLIQYEIESKNV